MFETLLGCGDADYALQRKALEYAERAHASDLLVRLARVRDLSPDVESALAERDELDVLMAWASRPNRKQAEVVARFSGEKRATLLLGLAETSGLPAELYAQFAKRKSVNVNWALLSNESVSPELKLELAAQLASGLKTANSSLYERLAPVQRASDEVYVTFVQNLANPYALSVLARWCAESAQPTLRVSALVDAAERLIKAEESYGGSSVLVDLLNGELSDDSRRLVEAAASTAVGPGGTDHLHWDLANAVRRSQLRRTFDKESLLEGIRQAGDPARLSSLAADFETLCRDLRIRVDQTELAAIVVANPNVDEALLNRYRMGLTTSSALAIARRAVGRKDISMAQTLFRLSSLTGIDSFGAVYEESEDPEQLVSWVCGDDAEAPPYVASSSAITKDRTLALRILPAATTLKSTAYSSAVAQMLSEQLGDDPQKWRMFTSLADEWSGSFTALLQTSVELAD